MCATTPVGRDWGENEALTRGMNEKAAQFKEAGGELDCSWSTRQNLTSRRGAFKRLGTDAAQMTVTA